MSFRPTLYPCSDMEPHEDHQHTDGPDNYTYVCPGRGEDNLCSYCGGTGWNGINAHYCDHCLAGPALAAKED